MATKQQTERTEALDRLREWVKPGDTVYAIIRHVSASGMQRTIQLVAFTCQDGKPEPVFIGGNVATALGYTWDGAHNGMKVRGAGMDMGFALVYELGQALYHDGYALRHRQL